MIGTVPIFENLCPTKLGRQSFDLPFRSAIRQYRYMPGTSTQFLYAGNTVVRTTKHENPHGDR